jgi:hypothetical protein
MKDYFFVVIFYFTIYSKIKKRRKTLMKREKIKFDLESFSIDDILKAVKRRKKHQKKKTLNKNKNS